MKKSFFYGKKVLVTGGAGFVGSYLTEKLVALGAKVTVPVRPETDTVFLSKVRKDIQIVKADLNDRSRAFKVTKNKDIVMNLAAQTGGLHYNMKIPDARLFWENINPFLNVIEGARVGGVERFLTTSSACVYPRYCTIPTPEEEGSKDSPEPTSEGYGWSKRMQEFLSAAYARDSEMKVAIARPYNTYGPRDNFMDDSASHVIPALIKRVFESKRSFTVWGDGEQSRAFLYVDDSVSGLLEITEKYPKADVLNIGTDEEVKIKDLAKLIVDVSGKKLDIKFDTSKPTGQPRRNCDTRKAKEKIQFQAQTPLREGIKKTMDWFLANYKKP